MTADPGAVLDKVDPGADVQRRFSYQHCFAALQCLRLLGGDLEAIFCENHEDILLRKKGGQYEALQIKTRLFELEPFKADDDAVIKSVGRFGRLEATYPGRFDAFHFITNHGFWCKKEDGKNLQYVRDNIRKIGNLDGLTKTNPLKKFVLAACGATGCHEPEVIAAICKLVLTGQQTDLERPFKDLRESVGQTRDYGRLHTVATVDRVADNLIQLCYEASSNVLGGAVSDLYALALDFGAQKDVLLLAGKTITAERIEQIIAASLLDGAENLLVSSGGASADLLPPGYDVMVEKMERGGLQMSRVDRVKDFKASLEHAYMTWLYRDGAKEANRRLAHIKTLVHDDCVEAQIDAEVPGSKYAPDMYRLLRQRLAQRLGFASTPLFGCSSEHLLGAAGMLTEECKVWWSDVFELKTKP